MGAADDDNYHNNNNEHHFRHEHVYQRSDHDHDDDNNNASFSTTHDDDERQLLFRQQRYDDGRCNYDDLLNNMEATTTATETSGATPTTSTVTATTATASPPPPSHGNGTCFPDYTCALGFGTPSSTNCSYLPSACSNIADCNANAVSLSGSIADGTCRCLRCRNSWSGSQCQTCPRKYNKYNDCRGCGVGYSGAWPACYRNCESWRNCSGRAFLVFGNDNTGCRCWCRNKYQGDVCQTCPRGYDLLQDCGACSVGYGGYPSCSPLCRLSNCSSHATSVSGTYRSGCNCYCRNKWQGANCETCPVGFDATADCGACAVGYSGYPSCASLCTNEVNCNGNAESVSGNLRTGCTCNCRNAWRGSTCDFCPARTNASNDCSSCDAGNHGYPKCVRTCSVDTDCSGHADNVTGDGTVKGCTCQCRNQWRGSSCSQCSYQFDSSKDCGACAAGFVPSPAFPVCLGQCNVTRDCSGHATSVSGDTSHGCECQCRNGWTGSRCETCSRYSTGADCDECITGFSGSPPSCSRPCTLDDCGGSTRAAAVSGTLSSSSTFGLCTCTCRNRFYGRSCQFCDIAQYDPFVCRDCNSPEYIQVGVEPASEGALPICSRSCTVARDCGGSRAYAVSGTVHSGCSCSCAGQWSGDSCGVCNFAKYTSDCSSCLSGLVSYPNCYPACDRAADCVAANTAAVTGNKLSGCTCQCRGQFFGDRCETCDTSVYAGAACDACRPFLDNYPTCTRPCSSELDCNNHASSVVGVTQAESMGSECVCTCRGQWGGDRCDVCPAKFDSDKGDCSVCAEGYDQSTYPMCYRSCTIKGNCSGRALRVSGNEQSGCVCEGCINAWAGLSCSECPYGFEEELSNCGSCSPLFTGYPKCKRDCTYSDCSMHATEVAGNTYDGCQCSCRNFWSSSATTTTATTAAAAGSGPAPYSKQCGVCAPNLDSSSAGDCGRCARGFTGTAPNCTRPCQLSIDCVGNRATSVSGDWPSCTCQCRASTRWVGASCESCPFPYDPLRDCSTCVAGHNYGGYPTCEVECTVAANCSGRAGWVERLEGSSSSSDVRCVCHDCVNLWEGDHCDVCPTGAVPELPFNCRPPDAPTTTMAPPPTTTTTTTALQTPTTTSTVTVTISSSTPAQTSPPTSSSATTTPSATSMPTTTTTTTTTLAPCTISNTNCFAAGTSRSERTSSSIVGGGGDCVCICAAMWSGRRCGTCSSWFNSSTGCASCSSIGFVATSGSAADRSLACACLRHLRFAVQIAAPPDPAPDVPTVAGAAEQDTADILRLAGNKCNRSVTSTTPSVESISLVAENKTHREWQIQVDVAVAGTSTQCAPVVQAASCFASHLTAGDCTSNFIRTRQALKQEASAADCTAAVVTVSSPCDDFPSRVCPAPSALDVSRYTPEPEPEPPFPWLYVLYIGAGVGGLLLLILLIMAVRKYTSFKNPFSGGRSGFFRSDEDGPRRVNAAFNPYAFATADMVTENRMFEDADADLGQELLAHSFKQQQEQSSGDFSLMRGRAAGGGSGAAAAALSALQAGGASSSACRQQQQQQQQEDVSDDDDDDDEYFADLRQSSGRGKNIKMEDI